MKVTQRPHYGSMAYINNHSFLQQQQPQEIVHVTQSIII